MPVASGSRPAISYSPFPIYRWLGVLALLPALDAVAAQLPDTVSFPSKDGKTQLVGYLFKPKGVGQFPAVVMLHERTGSYSTSAKGVYTADTLTQRHKSWGEFWTERGAMRPASAWIWRSAKRRNWRGNPFFPC